MAPATRIKSVSQFVDFVMNWKYESKIPTAFRGLSYHKYDTLPRVLRPDLKIARHENEAVRDIVSIHPQEFIHDQTMFDRLVRMQHFELPTRLLDTTTNPLVALWFASDQSLDESGIDRDGKVQAFFFPENRQAYYDSDKVSCLSNLANLTAKQREEIENNLSLTKKDFNKLPAVNALVHHIRAEKPHFSPAIEPLDLFRVIYVKPKMSNRRIIAQSGSFVIYGVTSLSGKLNSGKREVRIQRAFVDADSKPQIREDLERLGIHASAIFPEIDKAAHYILTKHQSREAVKAPPQIDEQDVKQTSEN